MAMRKLVPQLRVEQREVTVPVSSEYLGNYYADVTFSGPVVVSSVAHVQDNRPAQCLQVDTYKVRANVPTNATTDSTVVTITAIVFA